MNEYLLNKKVILNQPTDAFRTGMDTVLLSMTAPIIKSGNVLDVGAGAGALGLCYYKRLNNQSIKITGVEKRTEFFEYYFNNIKQNDCENNFNPINNDIIQTDIGKVCYDLVITNPPYESEKTACKSDNELKNIANIESTCDLQNWLSFCLSALKPNGYFAMIYKMDRLDEILHHLHLRLGDIRILPIITKIGENPKRVIIVGIKDSKSPLKMCEPLIVKDDEKPYTDFINEIMCGNKHIDLYKG